MQAIPVSVLCLSLLTLSACDRRPAASADVQEALALAAALQARGASAAAAAGLAADLAKLLQPLPGSHVSPDTLDPSSVVTEADVAASLQQACGAQGPAYYRVTIGRVRDDFAHYGGRGKITCRVDWRAVPRDGSNGAAGQLDVEVVGRPTYDLMKRAGGEPLANLGDDAYVYEGAPVVRVGELALTVTKSSGSLELSVEVLRRAAARMRK